MDQEKTKNLAEELKDISPAPNMPLEVFNALKRLLPMVAVEVLVLEKDSSFALVEKFGKLALPGGFMGFNESFEDACRRIVRKYLDIEIDDPKFVSVLNLPEKIHGSNQGHAIALLFEARSSQRSNKAKYFKIAPENILSHHKLMLDEFLKKS